MTKKKKGSWEWFLLLVPLVGLFLSFFLWIFQMKKLTNHYFQTALWTMSALLVSCVPMLIFYAVLRWCAPSVAIEGVVGLILSIALLTIMECVLLIYKTIVFRYMKRGETPI